MRPHDCIDYNPDTGDFRWRARPESDFANRQAWKAWNTKFAGYPVGYGHGNHIQFMFNGKHYQAGRVAYEIYSNTPLSQDSFVQYVDDNPFNLRTDNLRVIPRSLIGKKLFGKYGLPPTKRKASRSEDDTTSI